MKDLYWSGLLVEVMSYHKIQYAYTIRNHSQPMTWGEWIHFKGWPKFDTPNQAQSAFNSLKS